MLTLIGIAAIICGIIAALIADHKNRSPFGGFCLGFFLGIIGVAIISLFKTIPKE